MVGDAIQIELSVGGRAMPKGGGYISGQCEKSVRNTVVVACADGFFRRYWKRGSAQRTRAINAEKDANVEFQRRPTRYRCVAKAGWMGVWMMSCVSNGARGEDAANIRG